MQVLLEDIQRTLNARSVTLPDAVGMPERAPSSMPSVSRCEVIAAAEDSSGLAQLSTLRIAPPDTAERSSVFQHSGDDSPSSFRSRIMVGGQAVSG